MSTKSPPRSGYMDSCIFPVPLAVVEITPLNDNEMDISLSPEMARTQLKKLSLPYNQLDMIVESSRQADDNREMPTLYSGTIIHKNSKKKNKNLIHIQSDDPTIYEPIPYRIKGHIQIFHNESHYYSLDGNDKDIVPVIMTEGTHVRICSPLPITSSFTSSSSSYDQFLENSFFRNHSYSSLHSSTTMNSKLDDMQESLLSTVSNAKEFDETILSCHDRDIVQSLVLRMKLLFDTTHHVSTSRDAFEILDNKQKKQYRKSRYIQKAVRLYHQKRKAKIDRDGKCTMTIAQNTPPKNENDTFNAASSIIESNKELPKELTQTNKSQLMQTTLSPILLEGGLTVYNTHNSSGKTALITSIARHIFQCPNIHILNPGFLFAKYGVNYVDTALEGILYDLVLGAAVNCDRTKHEGYQEMSVGNDKKSNSEYFGYEVIPKENSVCIILDGLDGFVGLKDDTSKNGGGTNKGDPSTVALNAISAYLTNLSINLRNKKRFPYPSKNSILHTLTQRNGYVLQVHICLIGVVTIPTQLATNSQSISPLLNILGGRFLISPPSAETRLLAFQKAFKYVGINLKEEEAKTELENLALSAVHARGVLFSNVAQKLKAIIVQDEDEKNKDLIEGNRLKTSNNQYFCATKGQLCEAFIASGISSAPNISFTDFSKNHNELSNEDQEKKVESKKEPISFLQSSNVGGNMEAKIALENALALNPIIKKALAKFKLSPPTGVLLYGPPGTGKTLLARSTAESLKQLNRMNGRAPTGASSFGGGAFISLQASQVVRATVGNSEKIVVSAFEMARANAPSVVFIDEFQALFSERGKGSGRLATTLLQCMDDVSAWRDADLKAFLTDNEEGSLEGVSKRVVVLGATNAPWMIDKAFLRPGRFDRVVHVGLPDFEERRSILKVHLSKMKIESSRDTSIDKISLAMAAVCKGFSGADLAALCRAAAVRCLSENSTVKTDSHDVSEDLFVKDYHFQDARLFDVQNSSDIELVNKIAKWKP